MNLPETVCISLQAPQGLLDLGGFHWGDDIIFDSSNAGLDADAGFKGASALLKIIMQDVLIQKCGYKARELMLFGFGQGAMAALSTIRKYLSISVHHTIHIYPPVSRQHSVCTVDGGPAVSMHTAATVPSTVEAGGVISIGAALPQDAPASLSPTCKTPILVCAGSDQSAVTPSAESKLKHVFEFVDVKRYRRPGDGMPSNRDEMLPIMQFFSRRLRSVKGVPEGSIEVAL
nr:putative hydrolase c9g1.08c [Quercus suber]